MRTLRKPKLDTPWHGDSCYLRHWLPMGATLATPTVATLTKRHGLPQKKDSGYLQSYIGYLPKLILKFFHSYLRAYFLKNLNFPSFASHHWR